MRILLLLSILTLTNAAQARPAMRSLVSSVNIGGLPGLPSDIHLPRYCVKGSKLMRCEECGTQSLEWSVTEDEPNGFVEIRDACVNGLGLSFKTQYALFSAPGQNPSLFVSAWASGSSNVLRAFRLQGTQLLEISGASIMPGLPPSMFLSDNFDIGDLRPLITYTLPHFGTDLITDIDMPVSSVALSRMEYSSRKHVISFFKARKYFVILAFDAKLGRFVLKERRPRDNSSSAAASPFMTNLPDK